jgi:hypothetical protein
MRDGALEGFERALALRISTTVRAIAGIAFSSGQVLPAIIPAKDPAASAPPKTTKDKPGRQTVVIA